MLYVFNFATPLQHIFLDTNLELQLGAVRNSNARHQVHPKPSPWLSCSLARCGKHFQFSVKKGHISKIVCSKWGHYTTLFLHFLHLNVPYFTIIIIVKAMSQSSHLPWEPIKAIIGGGGGGSGPLAHFRALHFIINHFHFCLFPSIVDDIHIIGPPSIILYAYEHF